MEEHAGAATRGRTLQPRLQHVVAVLAQAAQRYTRRNVRVLYDAVITLAEVVGPALAEPSLASLLLPPLLDRWQRGGPQDRDAMPLMECLQVCAAHGAAWCVPREGSLLGMER